VIDLKEIIIKLQAARTRLVLERPFIGTLVMHLPLVPADAAWCGTVATDARAFYFNPGYIAGLSLAQTQFVLAHEALHCALAHFARRGHRTHRRWDIAADYAVNQLLADEGLKPPPGALIDPVFRGLCAEEIYPLLPAGIAQATLDRHLFDESRDAAERGGSRAGPTTPPAHASRAASSGEHAQDADGWDDAGDERRGRAGEQIPPREPDAVERERLAQQWQSRMVAAAQQARQAGRLGASWLRAVDAFVQPRLPWRQLLARYLLSIARDDYSFQRPSRREGDALLPRLASGEIDLHVALDTSGSIADAELAQFAAEVDALKGQIRARITLHACDARLDAAGPWSYQPWEPITLPKRLGGGGGTRFAPVFEWVAERHLRPDLLLYFTDAEGEFPKSAPGYPVLWLVKGRGLVPWGERIQLN
jgi:predicted metal-dependent peptidase